MAANDKVRFLSGADSAITNVTKKAGQILFGIDENNFGYIYYDKDNSTRVKMSGALVLEGDTILNITKNDTTGATEFTHTGRGLVFTVKGTQTAKTGDWLGNLPEIATASEMYDGLSILYYLPYAGNGNASLKLTFADGTQSANIPVYYTSTSRCTTHYGAGSTILLTYWSAGSISVAGTATTEPRWTAKEYNSDNTVTQQHTYTCLTAGAHPIARYSIIMMDNTGKYQSIMYHASTPASNSAAQGTNKVLNDSKFVLGKPIFYCNRSSELATNNVCSTSQIQSQVSLVDWRYTFNCGTTLVKNSPMLLKGTVDSNGYWTPSAPGYSNTWPTTDDGYVYIYIGTTYTDTAGYRGDFFGGSCEAYIFKDGGLRSYSGYTAEAAHAATATNATNDSAGQQINTTYIAGLSISGRTITYTRGDGSTGTLTTQDNNTDTKVNVKTRGTTKAYLLATTTSPTSSNQAVESVAETGVYLDTTAGVIHATTFDGNATTATSATSATNDSAGQQISTTYIKGLSCSGTTITYTKGGGGTDTISVAALPLAGGTMTGAIKRYYSSASTDPMISLVSNNLDAIALQMGHGGAAGIASQNYYKIVYNGVGNQPNNLFKLIAAKTTSTEVVAMSVNEEGNVTFTNTVAASISGTAEKANKDSLNQSITSTYIAGLSISGKTITYTKGDGTSGTIVTQDTNTDTKVNVKARGTTKAYLLATTTSPTSSDQAVESVAETGVYLDTTAGVIHATTFDGNATTATSATSATNDSLNQPISSTYIAGLSVSGTTITFTKGDGTSSTIVTQDTNTDTKVTNTLNTTKKFYVTGTDSSTTNTGTQYFDTGVYVDTTAGTLHATTFDGNATSATSATSATNDSAGQQINTTYIKNASVNQNTAIWTFTRGGGATFTVDNSNYPTQKLLRPAQLNGLNDATLQPLVSSARANRLAFLPPDQIIIEKTTDGGTTWVDAGISDATKRGLFSETRPGVNIPLINGVRNVNCGLRITFTAMKYNVPAGTAETAKYSYWNATNVQSQERYTQLKEFYFWLSSANDGISVKIERATGANPNNWTTVFENTSWAMTGWSGCDYVRIAQNTFGGGTNQTGNYWNYRMTFFTRNNQGATSPLATSSTSSVQSISEIRGYGDNAWGTPNSYMSKDHLYNWDYNLNAIFPANVTAIKFIGALQGNADTATTATNATNDSAGQQISTTYIKELSLSGLTLTIKKGNGGTSTLTLQDLDVKMNMKARGTTKAYLLGTTTSPTSSDQAVTGVAETGVYFDTTAAKLVATTFKGALEGNASTATSATKDSLNQPISSTYIAGLSVSGTTITFTKGDGTSGTIVTQDTNTDTKVNVKARGTTKAYLLATTTSPTSSNQAVESVAETGVYLDTTAGVIHATTFAGNATTATSATSATTDASGNTFTTTYLKNLKGTTSTTTYTIVGVRGGGGEFNTDAVVPAATTSIAGLVTTAAQTFAGAKTFNNGIEVYGTIAGDSSTTTGHGLYGGGGYHNAHNSIILHGDADGVSGIAFVSGKGTLGTDLTYINAPSDRAFIQFHSYGITTTTAEGTNPTLATTGELNRLVIGVGNDASDEVWLQTPSATGLKHQVGVNTYTVLTTGNYTSYIAYITGLSWTNGTTAGPVPVLATKLGGTINGSSIPAATSSISGIVTTDAQTMAGAKTFSTSVSTPTLTVTGSGGFNYSGMQAGTSDVDRIVWFADATYKGKPVYDNDFKYNPSTKVLKIGSNTFGSKISISAGDDSLYSTEAATLTVSGGASISMKLSAKSIRVDNGSTDTTKGFNIIYDSTNECLKFQFGN